MTGLHRNCVEYQIIAGAGGKWKFQKPQQQKSNNSCLRYVGKSGKERRIASRDLGSFLSQTRTERRVLQLHNPDCIVSRSVNPFKLGQLLQLIAALLTEPY